MNQFKKESKEKVGQLKTKMENNKIDENIEIQLKDTCDYFDLPLNSLFKDFEGKLVSGLKEGGVKETRYNGEEFTGTYVKGERTGSGFLKTEKFTFDGVFEFNQPRYQTGTITHFDQEGSFEKQFKNILNFIGEFKDREIHGRGTIYFRNRGGFEGEFNQGEVDGSKLGILLVPDGKGNY